MITTFRFDAVDHVYTMNGEIVPSITQMLSTCGFVDDRWFREEHSQRGREVHRLAAEFDLGALEITDTEPRTKYRGYLLAYKRAMEIIPHQWDAIEEPQVHPVYQFGGRPDRVGIMYNLHAVCEIKTGVEDRSHPVQTALQAIVMQPKVGIPAPQLGRYCLYVFGNGKFKLIQHVDRHDFDEAHRVIRRCTKFSEPLSTSA